MKQKEFKNFWIAGFIFSIFLSAINMSIGFLTANIYNSLFDGLPVWAAGLIILIVSIALLILIPYVVGRLIKWAYEEFHLY